MCSEKKRSKRSAAKLLRTAAKLIDTCGWRQHSYGDEECGFCSIGALSRANGTIEAGFQNYQLAKDALRKVSGMERFGVVGIVGWNDNPNRTKEEVTGAMRKAARALEHGLEV